MRLHFIDNLKGALIFLVVVGHFLIPVYQGGGPLAMTLFMRTIYLFHMPLFIFVSGFLAKRIYTDEGGLRVEKILSITLIGLLFHVLLCLLESKPDHIVSSILGLNFGASWYLIALAVWYMFTPLLSRLSPVPAILISVGAGLLSGCIPGFNHFLSSARIVGFFPFFLCGYYCSRVRLESILQSKWLIAVGAAGLAFLLAFWLTKGTILADAYNEVYLEGPYKNGMLHGICNRALIYCIASMLSLGVMLVVPKGQNAWLSYVGKNTLCIYIIHRVLRTAFKACGFYSLPIMNQAIPGIALILFVSVVVTAFCLIPIFSKPLDAILGMKWHWLLKQSKA